MNLPRMPVGKTGLGATIGYRDRQTSEKGGGVLDTPLTRT